MEKLIVIVKKIISANPNCLLSGSLAINLQGYKTRRDPSDIDLWISGHNHFIPIDGMEEDEGSDHYEEITHSRMSYKLDGVKIDVFAPVEWHKFYPLVTYSHDHNFRMLNIGEILKFKVEHSFDDVYYDEQAKHAQDIIFIFNELLEKRKSI